MSFKIFENEEAMIVLTTSPAGLGHVRVTEALRGGLSDRIRVKLLGVKNSRLQILHRIAGRNRVFRALMEWVQNSTVAEERFVKYSKKFLHKNSDEVFDRLVELVNRRRPKPKVLLVISTHHSLAHQVEDVKKRLAEKLKLKVILVVVVTDDTSQKIWGVSRADYIFVPSEVTKKNLLEYLNRFKSVPEVVVSPYPIDEDFSSPLNKEEFQDRSDQINPKKEAKLRVMIPISGAAVQLSYLKNIITILDQSKKAEATVVSRESKFTKRFLSWCQKRKIVEVIADVIDKDVVLNYKNTLTQETFSLEITKPSEQTFKVLCKPNQRGGVIMLFSKPVGRQEQDNLRFLDRHGLIPNVIERERINSIKTLNKDELTDLLTKAKKWRGLILPNKGKDAGQAILTWYKKGLFSAMLHFSEFIHPDELNGEGVKLFWKKIEEETRKFC